MSALFLALQTVNSSKSITYKLKHRLGTNLFQGHCIFLLLQKDISKKWNNQTIKKFRQ